MRIAFDLSRQLRATVKWAFDLMDRSTLIEALRRGPVRITMNDGSIFNVPSIELCAVTDIAAYLVTLADDGKWRGRYLSLVCMVSVEELVGSTS